MRCVQHSLQVAKGHCGDEVCTAVSLCGGEHNRVTLSQPHPLAHTLFSRTPSCTMLH